MWNILYRLGVSPKTCRFLVKQNLLNRTYCHWIHKTAKINENLIYLNILNDPKVACINRSYTSHNGDYPINYDMDNESDEILEQEISDSDNNLFCLKNILYNNSSDQLIQKLNKCESVDEIFRQIDNTHLTAQQSVQSVIVLWEQLKNCIKTKESIHQDTIPEMKFLFENIKNHSDKLTPDELTVCFLYLSKLNVSMQTDTMWILLKTCINLMQNNTDFPLTALSRFTVAVNSSKDLYTYFVCQEALPKIFNFLDRIETVEELRLITICLSNLYQLVSENVLKTYKDKVQMLYASGDLNSGTNRCLLKVIQFLNFPHWSHKNSILIRNLVLLLKDNIRTFHDKELDIIFNTFQSQLEPAEIVPILKKRAYELYQQNPSPELFACSVMYSLPDVRKSMTKTAEQLLCHSDELNSGTISTLYKILRLLKISNVDICNKYWREVIKMIEMNPKEQEQFMLSKHFHRYMNFNNNLAGTYRHENFEKFITKLLINDLYNGISALIPARFARSVSFILAYGQATNDSVGFPSLIVEKIIDMKEQFSIFDCLQLSRGLQLALDLRYKFFFPPKIGTDWVRIENVLTECAKRQITDPELTLDQLNNILRAYNIRKSCRKTSLFTDIINKMRSVSLEMSSRLVKDTTFNLNGCNVIMPNICESLVNYIVNNKKFVIGDTVEKVLYYIYNIGYFPENDEIYSCAADIINRDFDYMNGLSIVQASLALSFYRSLPNTLIDRIFNIDFIKRVEDEIQMCYSKETYPQRVFNQVMQLNRAVCLDFPEARVPWFQQNYIEAQLSKAPTIKDQFHIEITDLLQSFLPNKNLLKIDEITPYGYKIDFVIHFNKTKEIVPAPESSNLFITNIDKVAILLMKYDSFCLNEKSQLRGHEHLKHRHLETMGYKVIQVRHSDWQSMYMSVPGAKVNYLKNLLQI